MTEREIPPSGPLARLRAQLAAPRGVRRIDALLSADDAPGAVAALSPAEVFELVHEVGFEDATDLINLATPAQIQGCLDLDAWSKDTLELGPMKPWLAALIEAGFEKVGEVLAGLDAELLALIMQRMVKVYDVTLGEEPDEDNEAPMLTTSDRYFVLELFGDDESQRLTAQLVEDLYRADPALARHTIMAARAEPPAELEEQSYRWRAGRLADQGYVDFYEALDLFRPLDAAQVQIGEDSHERIVGDPDHAAQHLPLAVAQEVIGRGFLARAMAAIEEPGEAERLEGALMLLVNKVLAAGRAKPGQPEVVRRGALYATATLSLGLETVARGDLVRAPQALRTISLHRLFRVGYTVTQKLARLARALAARAVTAGSPVRELVAGLCSPRPLFARAADEPPAPGLRPFESQADLRRAGELLTALTLRVALAEGLGVDVVALGQAPEPRPALDDIIRTALARVAIGGALSAGALSQAELVALRRAMPDGTLPAAARAAGEAAVRQRLDAAQLSAGGAVLGRLVAGWYGELEERLGGITDAEIDPRFVEGVLVEVKRS
ncbi:MAG TPA: DUF6178 family protein [Kofleriaceae bacterium]|nr:DUF6178 family protein [Kofleriaceae bacterium]